MQGATTCRSLSPSGRRGTVGKPLSSSGQKRKRKKKKRKLPRTSSHSSSGCARRRQRQWHARFAGFAGYVTFRAVFPSVVAWPEMLGIMGGMDLKDSLRVWCAHRRLLQWHVQGLFFFLAQCSLWLQTGPDAGHHGRHRPEGYVRSWLVSLYGSLYLAVTCSIWFLPEEYNTCLFWEKVSRNAVFSASWFDSGYMLLPVYGFWSIVSVFSARLGSQWSTLCASYGVCVVDFAVVVQRPIPMVFAVQQTIVISQLQLLDQVIDGRVVRVVLAVPVVV